MNILVIKNPYRSQPNGGGEFHTMSVMKHLRKQGHNVSFVGSCRYLFEMAEAENFPVEKIDWAGQEAVTETAVIKFWFSKGLIQWRWREYLKKRHRQQPLDVLYVLSWNEKFLLAPITKEFGIKMVFVEHVLLGRFIKSNPFRRHYVKSTEYATTVAVSKAVRESVTACGVNPKRTKVIYNGINIDEFPEQARDGGCRIGTISRLCEQKGLKYLVMAAALLHKKRPELRVDIVGQGDAKQEIVDLIKEHGLENTVSLKGGLPHEKLARFLSTLNLFVYTPVYGEAFGFAVAEAGATGLASVVTDVGGVPEIVADSKTGLVVPPEDEQALAKGIAKLLKGKNLRSKMGRAARQRISEKFTVERMLREFADLIENI